MKRLNLLAALLLMVAGFQTAWGQGFRVYKSDGTVAQFSLRADSIVFYDGIGSEEDFGPFTPVNQYVAGTWHVSPDKTVTFNEDGTTDYPQGSTYRYLPCQSTLVIYNASGVPVQVFKVHDVMAGTMVVSSLGSDGFSVWSGTQPDPQPDDHDYVDLGLPSGTLWATCNVGASSPEEYGDYFAWGETEPKDTYDWWTYFDTEDDGSTFKKYNNDGGLTELLPEDDAATVNWGSGWQMPSLDQIDELINCNYTTTEWTTLNGVNGRKVTSRSNGNSIFLPAAGDRYDTSLSSVGGYGYY